MPFSPVNNLNIALRILRNAAGPSGTRRTSWQTPGLYLPGLDLRIMERHDLPWRAVSALALYWNAVSNGAAGALGGYALVSPLGVKH